MQSNTAALQPLRGIEQTVVLAFRIAHLLTASVARSESAVMEAIDSFEPDLDSHEDLLRGAIRAAIQRPPSQLQAIDSFLQSELRAVLSLPTELRQCFVLRFGSSGESVGSTTALDGNSDANETETTESTVRARLDSKSL